MQKRIIYKNPDGSVSVIIPSPDCDLTLEQIAAKDVPFGRPYKVVDAAELPQDRSERDLWTIDDEALTDGVGADYGVGSENVVVGWSREGRPMTARHQPEQLSLELPRPTVMKIRKPRPNE